jgi:dCMP deaminase
MEESLRDRRIKRDMWYLTQAQLHSLPSKDPSTKCGCIIVHPDHGIVAGGWNKFPKGMRPVKELLDNRDEKYSRTIHSEMMALNNAGHDARGSVMYSWPFLPCDRCAVHVVEAGIKLVVTVETAPEILERWSESYERAKKYFSETRVKVRIYERETYAAARDQLLEALGRNSG